MLDLKQILTWNVESRSIDYIYINVNHISVIETHSFEPDFDPSPLFYAQNLPGNDTIRYIPGTEIPVNGLTIYTVTMSGGREIHIPSPQCWGSSLWQKLDIPVP